MIRFNKGFVQYCRLLIALLMSVLWAPVVTGAPQLASGTFVANQSCPAYQSKNKQTNPY